jgi:hypothetical protein
MKFARSPHVLAAAAAAFLAACATGGRTPSGFLGNVSQLGAGYGTTDAVAAYLKPGADLRQYDSVVIDPVTTIFASPALTPQVAEQLAAGLQDSMRAETGHGLRLVSSPGPRTLRVRTALTDVIPGQKTGGRPVKTVHSAPRATLDGTVGSAALAAALSMISFEGEVVDSVTGERICALCDHRIGAKREAEPSMHWSSIRSATQRGVHRMYERLRGTTAP